MLDVYIQKSKTSDTCIDGKESDQDICSVEMDVNYIKKSKDEKYHLVYHLRNDSLSYFDKS